MKSVTVPYIFEYESKVLLNENDEYKTLRVDLDVDVVKSSETFDSGCYVSSFRINEINDMTNGVPYKDMSASLKVFEDLYKSVRAEINEFIDKREGYLIDKADFDS